MSKKHLFFDLDRTLWDFEANSKIALEVLFGTKLSDRIESFERFHRTYRNENALLWRKYGKGKINKEYLYTERFHKTLVKFGVYDRQLVSELSEDYMSLSPQQTVLLPNTHETLSKLKQLGYKLHVITNGFHEVQHAKITNCNLRHYFDLVLCSDDVGVSKPTPEIFAQALFQSGAKASESVMIGDDYDVDVMGAIRQGFHGIHFDPKAKRIGRSGIWRIRDLNQLPEMLLDIFS